MPYTQLVELDACAFPSSSRCAYEESKTLLSQKTKYATSDDSTNGSHMSTTDSLQSLPPEREKIQKIGMIQKFEHSEGPLENFSSSLFTADEVHKIAILDLRILNLDRNLCNVLVKKTSSEKWSLVPIDHGLSIPDTLEINSYEVGWLSFE